MKKIIAVLMAVALLSGCGLIDRFTPTENKEFEEYVLENNEDTQNLENNDNKDKEEQVEKTAEEIKEDYIDEFMSKMTLEEKVGQMFMVAWRKDSNDNGITAVNDLISKDIENIKPGGVILFGENIDTEEQTKEYIENLQSISDIPLFMGIDEEGGRVSRLHQSGKINTPNIPTAQYMAENGRPSDAENNMSIIANEIKKLGFNVDFAPVADINTNPENTVIGDRAFGSDPETVSEFVVSAVKGLQKNNVAACVKHFPGHGDTYTDTHNTETFVNHDMARLESCELVPFKSAIENGVDFVMVSHIKVPNVDDSGLPSSLSKSVVTGILRDYLGFEGVVITDALDMGAISEYYTSEEVAKYALDAGVDIFLMPDDTYAMYNYIVNSVKNGEISQKRIDQSVERILNEKYDIGLINIENK